MAKKLSEVAKKLTEKYDEKLAGEMWDIITLKAQITSLLDDIEFSIQRAKERHLQNARHFGRLVSTEDVIRLAILQEKLQWKIEQLADKGVDDEDFQWALTDNDNN